MGQKQFEKFEVAWHFKKIALNLCQYTLNYALTDLTGLTEIFNRLTDLTVNRFPSVNLPPYTAEKSII